MDIASGQVCFFLCPLRNLPRLFIQLEDLRVNMPDKVTSRGDFFACSRQ